MISSHIAPISESSLFSCVNNSKERVYHDHQFGPVSYRLDHLRPNTYKSDEDEPVPLLLMPSFQVLSDHIEMSISILNSFILAVP